jgi:hypothetical protein
MNIFTKALTPAKREAQSRVVDVLMDRSRILSENGERYANPMLYVVCVAKLCRPLRRAA